MITLSNECDDDNRDEDVELDTLTSIKAGFHKHSNGFHTKLKVLRCDMCSIAHNKRQRLHTLDEGLGVMQTHVLTQG